MKQLISILIPAYNEEAVLEQLFARLEPVMAGQKKYDFELVFIDDGSRDRTGEIIQEHAAHDRRITYIGLSRNFGKETAMLAGFDHVKGDAMIVIDADLQDPPELIPEMIKYWQQGYDDVYAKRRSRDGESTLKKMTSRWYYRLLKRLTRVEIQEDTGDFRLLDRRCIEALRLFRESGRYTKGMFSWIGYRKKALLYDRDPRAAGETKWNYPRLVGLAIDGITSFTTAPLRVSSMLGIVISGLSFLYIIYLLIRPLFGVPVGSGYTSLMAVIWFLGGVQLLSLGVIGEYVGRIFNETKHRPPYLIDQLKESHYGKTEKSDQV